MFCLQELLTWQDCCNLITGLSGIRKDFTTERAKNLCWYLEYEWTGLCFNYL